MRGPRGIAGPLEVNGPGPVEPPAGQPSEETAESTDEPEPEADKDHPPLPRPSLSNDPPPAPPPRNSGDSEGDDDLASSPTGAPSNDPYSNLGGAFGGYAADEPRPEGSHGRHGYDDVLI